MSSPPIEHGRGGADVGLRHHPRARRRHTDHRAGRVGARARGRHVDDPAGQSAARIALDDPAHRGGEAARLCISITTSTVPRIHPGRSREQELLRDRVDIVLELGDEDARGGVGGGCANGQCGRGCRCGDDQESPCRPCHASDLAVRIRSNEGRASCRRTGKPPPCGGGTAVPKTPSHPHRARPRPACARPGPGGDDRLAGRPAGRRADPGLSPALLHA